jgi:hypothetical protein
LELLQLLDREEGLAMVNLFERHRSKIRGMLSCLDRVVITGTLPDICHAQVLERHLSFRGVRLFDYARWAEPMREQTRDNAERLAREAGLRIEFIQRKNFRKEERVKKILAERGGHPGLVHIFSAMEPCPSFRPWHDKKTGRTSLRPTQAKCLHYYFYFVDPDLGLCYLRVPTWAPFRLQFYFNGHNQLACQLRALGIGFEMGDNAFVTLDDFERAQQLAGHFDVEALHGLLDELAQTYCPVVARFASGYHWSLMQVEYATDLVWKRAEDLAPLYDLLVREAVHTVRAEQVASFLGRRLHPLYDGELGTDFHTRVEGSRIKHHMGKASIKMYDKLGRVLRIETTANDVTFFRHHRWVEHHNGTRTKKIAPVKKTIYSLPALMEILEAANRRYLEFLAILEDPTDGIRDLERIGRRVHDGRRTHRGFNLFEGEDRKLFETLLRGEFHLRGFQNRHLQHHLGKSSGQVSRLLKRLRTHGLIKKVRNSYRYYLTKLGQRVLLIALKLRRFYLIPELARRACA